jgi:hypothetical protein
MAISHMLVADIVLVVMIIITAVTASRIGWFRNLSLCMMKQRQNTNDRLLTSGLNALLRRICNYGGAVLPPH